MAKLYLIPNLISEGSMNAAIPPDVAPQVSQLSHFAVESLKQARRYLRKLNRDFDIDNSTFFILNKKSGPEEIQEMISCIKAGNDLGIITDAGCPGVADPGSLLVYAAHEAGIHIKPMVGPSSILLALMGSGLNGQSFSFHGYVPKDQKGRIAFLKRIESTAHRFGETQIFMDTPFRNNYVAQDVLENCAAHTKFTIACDLTAQDEYIKTKTIEEWNSGNLPFIHKKPCLFLIGK